MMFKAPQRYVQFYFRTRDGGGQLVPHVKDEEINDLAGYFGDEPGIPVVLPAGSFAVFSGFTFHCSGFNTTDKMRRLYLAQYGDSIGRSPDGKAFGRTEVLLANGVHIR